MASNGRCGLGDSSLSPLFAISLFHPCSIAAKATFAGLKIGATVDYCLRRERGLMFRKRGLMVARLALLLGGLAVVGAVSGAARAETIPGQYIVVLKPGADRAAMVNYTRSLGGDVLMQYRYALNGFALRLPETAVGALNNDRRVLFVVEDGEVSALAQVLTRNVDRIDAETSSTRSGDGRGSVKINVAVLDTGIDSTHPELNVVGGTNCTNDKAGFSDPDGHGTFAAGIIGARDNDDGIVGVAPDARLWAVRVLNKHGFGNDSMVICGIDFVTSTRLNADSSDDIAVANMSLGDKGSDDGNCGLTNNDAVHMAICNSVAAGVTYVVAAGNAGADMQNFLPSSYDEVLSVTAMADFDGKPGGLAATDPRCPAGSDDSAATFSNFATLTADQAHTVAAPGVCVVSTLPSGLFAFSSGTSFSAPHAAGTAALCIASGSCAGLTPGQIVQKIVSDAGAYNNSRNGTGYGFRGDPLRPISGKYYGYLIRAGLY